MRRLPPLRSLEAFTRTVRLGSARAAAEELALSPSALSRRIATLEEFTGKRLFSRQKQAMKLTDEGEAFFRAVAPRIDALADAIDGQVEDGRLHRLHLGVMPLFGSQRLFPRLGELRRQYPQLHIDIDTSPHLEARVGDTLDAAIVLSEEPDQALYSVRLDHNRVFAIADRATAEDVGDTPDEARLARQTFMVHNELAESFNAWRQNIGLPGLQPAAIDHYDSGQLILEAAAQGLGIAIMHDDHLARAKDERLAALFPDIEVESPFSYWFVCRPGALETRAVRQFHDWLIGAGL